MCPTLCNPMGCSLPGSSVHGQPKNTEYVVYPFSRGYSQTGVSCIADGVFTSWATREPPRSGLSLGKYKLKTSIENHHQYSVTIWRGCGDRESGKKSTEEKGKWTQVPSLAKGKWSFWYKGWNHQGWTKEWQALWIYRSWVGTEGKIIQIKVTSWEMQEVKILLRRQKSIYKLLEIISTDDFWESSL